MLTQLIHTCEPPTLADGIKISKKHGHLPCILGLLLADMFMYENKMTCKNKQDQKFTKIWRHARFYGGQPAPLKAAAFP